ncbi:tyrosine-protein phosphatase [Hasllibacter sp. MH4015]|uniref:phosphatase domain-containing putative toxin n=1 Tax=Hasllibacter sp. MH4015 TaxID=2854029 RepID=UPI001CD44A28|nr:tyrosine-protein phosphatase [Hasllibacter sp. MH4015]
MSLSILDKAKGIWAVATRRYDQRIDTPLGRFQGRVFALFPDHGFVRGRWRNEGQIADGLYRSNHPHPRALAAYKARGIVQVISLRPPEGPVHAFEAEACAALGLELRNAPLTARQAPSREALLNVLEVFDTIRLPALIHCKSGADRTGLVAAMWHIHVEGQSPHEARRELSFRHLHISLSKTGILDRLLDAYTARWDLDRMPLRDWIETEYDPEKL